MRRRSATTLNPEQISKIITEVKDKSEVHQSALEQLPRLPQRQDSVFDQLRDLIFVADTLGMYDAADYLRNTMTRVEKERGE